MQSRARPPVAALYPNMQYRHVATADQLRDYCRDASGANTIAFDTEFVSEHTYRPVLCLIQAAAEGEPAVIDAIAVGDVNPFWELIAAPGREIVVHAGRGEVEFCLRSIGRRPQRMFDVQVAAALAGAEYPAGLGSLVSKFLGRRPPKHETRTDWRRRPLSKRQIQYALGDATCLLPLYEAIREELARLGRVDWLAEEMDSLLEEIERYTFEEHWRRLAGNAPLDGRGMAVVRELYRWRQSEARRRDKPVRRVLRDDLIVELARRGSADPKRIGAVRGLERGDLRRRLGEIAEAVERGIENPEPERATRPTRDGGRELSVLGQFLFAVLGNLCRRANLAPNLVGTPGDIRRWLTSRLRNDWVGPPPKLARGWRAKFVGRLFEDLLAGKTAVRIGEADPEAPLLFEPPIS